MLLIPTLVLLLSSGAEPDWSGFPSTDAPPATREPTEAASAQTPPAPVTAPAAVTPVPAAALRRYQEASALVTAGRYAQATTLLNQLTTEHPRVAEFFAARCSAQLGLKQPGYAAADCRYAYRLKPTLVMALYGLACAEDALGQRELAVQHYREYAQSTEGSARPELVMAASSRADVLTGTAGAVAPTGRAPAAPAPPRLMGKPQCLTGSDGRQTCGYGCLLGTDGISACADAPEGTCAVGADGHATCSQVTERGGANAGGKPPECHLGTDGRQVCGYNCRMGTNGRYFCAARPDGTCAINPDGTFTCS